MNKKFLFGAALVGLLGFASCVDNNESPSVTKVRESKAAQLVALGEAAKIQAEAEKLAAEGEKELAAAEAAYKKALEEQVKAQTQQEQELAAIRLQEAQERLNQTIAANKIALESLKLELDQKKAQYEQTLLDLKRNERYHLNELYDDYNDAMNSLLNHQQYLADAQARLAKLQANIITAQESNQSQIALNNKDITSYENQIAKNQEEIATLEDNMNSSLPELEEKLATANASKDKVQATINQLEGVLYNASDTEQAAQATIDNSIYVQQLKTVLYDRTFGFDAGVSGIVEVGNSNNILGGESSWENVPGFEVNGRQVLPDGTWAFYVWNSKTSKYDFTEIVSAKVNTQETLDKPAEAGQVAETTAAYNVQSGYEVQEAGVKTMVAYLNGCLTTAYTKPYEDAKKKYDDCVKDQDAKQKAADAAKAALDAAKADQTAKDKAVTDAQAAVTAAEKALAEANKGTDSAKITAAQNALTNAQTALSNAQTAAINAATAVTNATTKFNEANTALATAADATDQALTAMNKAEDNTAAKETIESIQNAFNKAVAELPNYKKFVAAYNDSQKAVAQAELDLIAPYAERATIEGEIQGLEGLINGQSKDSILATIDQLERDIINYEGQIVSLKQWNDRLKDPEVYSNRGETIEELNNTISKYEQQITLDKDLVAAAKKALEDAINSSDSAE